MKKRILSLLLALCLLAGLIPAVSAATLDNGLTYEVYEDHVEITGYEGSAAELAIPAEIDGKPVTIIGCEAFRDCQTITSVTIPDSCTSIGEWAFLNCPNLVSVVIPGSVQEIGQAAFSWSEKLKDVTMTSGITTIGKYAFNGCNGLNTITIPETVTLIDICAFGQCSSLESIWFTGDAPSFAYDTFYKTYATAYYPVHNATWTADVLKDYNGGDGSITWVPYDPSNPFTDVPTDSFYYSPVLWALENGITTGASETTFNPNGQCLRAQVVTFLWRAEGSPEPASTVNPFVDVKESDFYYKAVLWAVEQGITNGSDATHFNPMGVCNRAQVVTFLHRAFGSPAPDSLDLPFTDVPAGAWYEAPIAWAVENGITNGLSATEFGPNAACNRAQVVTFLYRAYN